MNKNRLAWTFCDQLFVVISLFAAAPIFRFDRIEYRNKHDFYIPYVGFLIYTYDGAIWPI